MLLISGVNFDAYGQELVRRQGPKNKWGFVDKATGEVVIPYIYKEVSPFSEGLAAVKSGNKWGFIDKTGKVVIQFNYDGAGGFSEGLAPVCIRSKWWDEKLLEKWGYINKTGKIMWPIAYGSISLLESFKERALEQERKEQAENERIIALQETKEMIERDKKAAQQAERDRKANSFIIFANGYVDTKISEWKRRYENETIDQWQQRVDSQESTKTAEFYKEAELEFITERSQNFSMGSASFGNYNSTNNVFLIKTDFHGVLLLPVSANDAQNFQNQWNNSIRRPQFAIFDDCLALSGINFNALDGTSQQYNFDPAVKITISEENLAILQHGQQPHSENIPVKETSQPAVTPQPSGSYDIILLKNGQEIKAKVDEITLSEIKYKSFDNIYGPTRNVAKNNAVAIIYANGQREVISSETTTEKSTTDNKMNNQGDFGIGVSGVAGAGGITLYGICGAVRYSVNDLLRMEGSFTYYPTKTYKSWGIEQEFKVWSISLNSQPILPPLNGENFLLYPLVGIGIIGVKETQRDWLRSEVYDIVYFGFNTGVGFDLRLLKNLFFNLEGKYTKCLTKDNDRYWFMGSAGLVIKF